VKPYTSASDCKGVGNVPENHFVKAYSALPSHSSWCQHHKRTVHSMLISVKTTGKNRLEPRKEYGNYSSVVTLFFANKSLIKTDGCAGALS
jgi:hypothetical protein